MDKGLGTAWGHTRLTQPKPPCLGREGAAGDEAPCGGVEAWDAARSIVLKKGGRLLFAAPRGSGSGAIVPEQRAGVHGNPLVERNLLGRSAAPSGHAGTGAPWPTGGPHPGTPRALLPTTRAACPSHLLSMF